MSADLARLRAATPKQQALLDALVAGGWTVVAIPLPGGVIVGHPDNEREIPTPDYAREERRGRALYPFPTYTVLHQLTILYDVTGKVTETEIPIKIRTVLKREAAAPWVTAHDGIVGLGAAIDYVKAPHPASDSAAPVVMQEER